MKDNRFFRHDWGARNDPKIMRLVRVHGAAAKAVYWDIVEMLYEQGGSIPIDAIEDIAFFNHLDNSEIVRFVVFESGLFSYDETHFWSERQKRDSNKIREISEARSRSGRAGGIASGEQRRSKNEANANQNGSKDEAINKINKTTSSLHSEVEVESKDSCPQEENIFGNDEIEIVPKDMTPEEMVAIWNEGCGQLPKARTLSDKRVQKAKARIKEFGKTRDEQIEVMREITAKLRDSDYANGRINGWRADFGWIIENSENWVKVIEGRYDNKKPSNGKYSDDKWNR